MTTRFLPTLNPPLSDRLYIGWSRYSRTVKCWWQQGYKKLYQHLRLYQVVAQFGGSFDLQFALLPEDLSDLVQQIILIRTTDIQWGGRPPREYRKSGFMIEPGDWDLVKKEPIKSYLESDIYCRSIRQLFVEGRPIEKTDQYVQMTQRLAAGETPKKCQSLEDIYTNFSGIYKAYETMKTEGYKTQAELNSPNLQDEIMVYIDRNGEFHKQQGSGHHRLALARLLEVAEVPVCVLSIHKEWAKKCYERYGKTIIFAVNQGLKERAVLGS